MKIEQTGTGTIEITTTNKKKIEISCSEDGESFSIRTNDEECIIKEGASYEHKN